MERRTFMQTTLAGAACAATATSAIGADVGGSELYELKTYSMKKAKQPRLDDYLKTAFLPAIKRLKIGPVGVFVEEAGEEDARVFVLIVHSNAESSVTLDARLAADAEYQQAGKEYLAAGPKDSVYQRIESSLMVPFAGMPKLQPFDGSKPRIFQLRTYESHNERANRKKVEMFNQGEIAIFRRVGLTPVFFGQTVVGSVMPNLTYMLAFADDQALKSAWQTFRVDPEWVKLKSIPEYADAEIVSKITNRIVKPTPYSEI